MPALLAAALLATLIPIPPGVPPAVAPPPAVVPSPVDLVPPAAPPTEKRLWYGLPALAIDGLTLTLAMSGFSGREGGILVLGAAGYFLTGPINHLAHRRPGAAAGSFLLRAAAAGVAVAVFIDSYSSEHCDGDVYAGHPCQHETAMVLGGLAMAAAAIIDDVAIARAAPPPPARPRASVAPGLLVTRNAGMLSLGGAF